jgi:hypothetical protein
MSLVNNTIVQRLVYWIFNIISPSINAQVIITYIMAHKSKFCKIFAGDSSIFQQVGDDTIGLNWVILVLHIIILLLLLIAMDTGLLKFSFSFSFSPRPVVFNEAALDNDVLAERRRVLTLNPLEINRYPVNTDDNNEDGQKTDHLTVHDLIKFYRGGTVCAVNHLTFGAKRGEAFGLLGYNVSHIKIFKIEKYKFTNRVLVKQQHFVYLSVMKLQHLAQVILMDKMLAVV